MVDKNFKGTNGQWLTKGLFKEFNPDGIYTIPEMKALYLASNDPTEYRFAMDHLGGLQHWQVLQKSWELKDHIAEWREELDLKIRSTALVGLLTVASGSSKDAVLINRWIVEGGYTPKATKGRPSKQQIAAKAQEIAEDRNRLSADAERLFN